MASNWCLHVLSSIKNFFPFLDLAFWILNVFQAEILHKLVENLTSFFAKPRYIYDADHNLDVALQLLPMFNQFLCLDTC